jgi:methionyl-tRNA formyltransferase
MHNTRIVVITGDDLEHRYLANRLAVQIRPTAIVVDHGKPVRALDRYKRLWRRYTLRQLYSRAVLATFKKLERHDARRRARIMSVFGPANCLEFSHPELLQHVHGINTAEGVRVVSSLEPDLILVFGTGIVGNKILSLARRVALNMHTGISPYYRGCDCSFWPVHNGEPHMLGATVHECTSQIDGGKILGTTRADLAADDCLFSVFARCVIAGTELYARTVNQLVSADVAVADQNLSVGAEYKAYMRDLWSELRARHSIRTGLIRHYLENSTSSWSKSIKYPSPGSTELK